MLHLLMKPLVLRAFLLALLVAPVVVVTVTPGLRPADLMARYLGYQLDSLPDPLVADQTRQIAALDTAGTAVLVRALGHRRRVVSINAGTALHAQLDLWAQLPARESSPRVARLAELLAQRVAHWQAAPRSLAADLAARILEWPLHAQSVAKPQLYAHCEQIVRAAAAHPQEPSSAARDAELAADGAQYSLQRVAKSQAPSELLDLPRSGVPGGDLPIDEVPIPPLPPALVDPPHMQDTAGDEPGLLPPSARPQPGILFPAERSEAEEPGSLPAPPPAVRGRISDSDTQEATDNTLVPASMTEPVLQAERLEQLSDLELIHRLRRASGTELKAVEQQLAQRGIGASQLEMARRLTDPNPLVRRQLAESLSTQSRSPGPWLFWLSYDPDPMVRTLIVSLMATSQDPRLHRRLREMQSLETDETVRAQLDKLNENHRGR